MIGPFLQVLLTIMAFAIMLGLGAALVPRDFLLVLRNPYKPMIGLLCQFGIMPLLGFLLSLFLNLPEAVAVALLIISCMPGGATSNLFAYLSKGNVALSISMTATSTIAGFLVIPIVISIYAAALDVQIPRENIVVSLLMLLVPLTLGMTVRSLRPSAAKYLERIGSVLGSALIAVILLVWFFQNWDLLASTSPRVYTAIISLGLFGFLFGLLLARAFRLNWRDARTVSLETGIQNVPLAIAIIVLSFDTRAQQELLPVVALYAIFIVLISVLATALYRRPA